MRKMEKKPISRLKEIQDDLERGKIPQKPRKIPQKAQLQGFLIYFLISIILIMSIWFGIEYYGGMSFFDENVTHRSCDFLSIEGFPTLVRCSDGTYWDASKHTDGQSGSVEEIVPVAMVMEVTQPPFPYQKVDTSKL